jgi:anti-anti-sigma factor
MSNDGLTITHEDLGESLRKIAIIGRLDTTGTSEMSEELRALTAAPKKGVVVDLTGVPFLASVGIGQLIVNAREVKARGGHMVLVAIGGSSVMMSLKMTGIDKLIPVFDNPGEAFQAALRGF